MPTVGAVKSGMDCLQAAQRSLGWLQHQQRPDGGWKALDAVPIDGLYKTSWALSLMGEAAAAGRGLDYVRRHLMTDIGDFLPRRGLWHRNVHYLYANAYVVIGAQKIERYEIARPGLAFILSQQDARHGGFYSRKTTPGESEISDTMSTGICGIACLAVGEIEAAKKAAGGLNQLIEMQPTPDERFYTTFETDGSLGTDFPSDQTRWRVIQIGEKDQCWYAVGLPFVLAILLHQATGDEQYAAQAQWFFDFQSRCVNPWDGSSSGKAAWGCSLLYRITGEQRYREIALHVADNIVGWQTPEGWFDLGRGSTYTEDGSREFGPGDFDLAAEYTLWLGLVGTNLLTRDGA